jgi:hypothetical protein
MPEDKANPEVSKKMSRREFLKMTGSAGVLGGIVALNVFLRTKKGKKYIARILEGDFRQSPDIEIDEESKRILNLFNETIEKSLEKLGPVEQEAARELEKRRDVVFAAAEKEWCQLKISLNEEGDWSASINFSYSPIAEKASIEINLPNMFTPAEMVKSFSHELGHAYQYIVLLNEFGFKGKEVGEFVTNCHSIAEYEMDAWIFDNLAAYLYSSTHPNDKNYAFLFDPKQTGVDEIGFTGYWLGRKEKFPQKLTDDLEYKWFLERYAALSDVVLDILSGEDHGPPVFPLTVRDSEVSVEFIEEASKYFIPSSYSEAIGLEMDPTESNVFIWRHFFLGEE